MRILVCGGRDYSDRDQFEVVINDIASRNRIGRIIQGGASGADAIAREWCVKWRYSYENFPADWKTHGRSAGPIRNQQMIDEGRPDIVIAFPGGRGTVDMIRRAKKAGIPVRIIE